jgi:hypothetical protein
MLISNQLENLAFLVLVGAELHSCPRGQVLTLHSHVAEREPRSQSSSTFHGSLWYVEKVGSPASCFVCGGEAKV